MLKKLLLLLIYFTLFNSCKDPPPDSSTTLSDTTSTKAIEIEPVEKKQMVQWDSIKSDDDYTKFIKLIKNNRVNQKKTIKTESGKEEIVYLGTINDESGNVISHILTL